MMSPDQLRALADALEPMAAAPRFDGLPVAEFCAWLRQCADAEPVAWRVECRWKDRSKGGDWRKYADYGTEQAAASSQQVFAKPGDIESRIVPLFTHPAPAAPQAEPSLTRRLHDAGFTRRDDRIECDECGKKITPQFLPIHECEAQAEPKREPLSDDEISKLAWKQNIWTDGMIEFSFLAFAREIENAHGIGGSDAE